MFGDPAGAGGLSGFEDVVPWVTVQTNVTADESN
jgi:hypothetical protein